MLLESSWTGDLFVDSVLNQGREEDQDGKGVIPPVRRASDQSFQEGKRIIITYGFAMKKSKFDYSDDHVKKIKHYAIFSKEKKRDISNQFKSISDYINVDFKKVKDRKTFGTIRVGFKTITDESG